MNTILDNYERLAYRTDRPCYSVTFWRTQGGDWGARAGLGTHEFGASIEEAIDKAVSNAIEAQEERKRLDAAGQGVKV
jgi:hypothetical protein